MFLPIDVQFSRKSDNMLGSPHLPP